MHILEHEWILFSRKLTPDVTEQQVTIKCN